VGLVGKGGFGTANLCGAFRPDDPRLRACPEIPARKPSTSATTVYMPLDPPAKNAPVDGSTLTGDFVYGVAQCDSRFARRRYSPG
jgi:hypothetical protein